MLPLPLSRKQFAYYCIDMNKAGNLYDLMNGENVGTLINSEK